MEKLYEKLYRSTSETQLGYSHSCWLDSHNDSVEEDTCTTERDSVGLLGYRRILYYY